MKKTEIIIVGGGASGMVAAIAAARAGADVTVIEQQDRLGKKILSTGNGKCNLTNIHMDPSCFRGDDTEIVESVLKQFGYEETVRFFEELGVLMKNRDGYLYPISEQASAIADVLIMEMQRLSIHILLGEKVNQIEKQESDFLVHTSKQVVSCKSVILATGSKASAVAGSDGSGYSLAKSFRHHISQVVPALVQLRCRGNFFKIVSGVRTQAKVSLFVDQKFVSSDIGELQLTNYGISGIPVFQISRYAAKAIANNQEVTAEIDFMPRMNDVEFRTFLIERLKLHGNRSAEEFFVGIFNRKIIELLLKLTFVPSHICAADIREDKWDKLFALCKHFPVEIQETNPFEQAQICAGGVLTCELNPSTMESLLVPNLYVTGELMDIDGICGGYNLQWAWSTGIIAGKAAAKGVHI